MPSAEAMTPPVDCQGGRDGPAPRTPVVRSAPSALPKAAARIDTDYLIAGPARPGRRSLMS
ncbi:MAG: hypothetical protein ABSA53_33700 [Streptosporangiaceae bacterium]|jgi:hypothetical protein